jgi:hypothetical protein
LVRMLWSMATFRSYGLQMNGSATGVADPFYTYRVAGRMRRVSRHWSYVLYAR